MGRRTRAAGVIRALTLALAPLLLGGCATTYAIVHLGDGVAGQDGLRLSGAGDAWDGSPRDLPNYLTPILVDIENHTNKNIRIRYADFALTNDRGFRYAAINPYSSRVQVGINEGANVSMADHGARLTLAAYGGHRRAHRAPPRRRVFVRPGHRVYLHFHPWVYPYYEAPFYGDSVVVWDDTAAAPPSEDVLRLGLPEGVLKPGGRIFGFLYFQGAGQRSNHLQLTWSAHATDGSGVATLQVPFAVVPR